MLVYRNKENYGGFTRHKRDRQVGLLGSQTVVEFTRLDREQNEFIGTEQTVMEELKDITERIISVYRRNTIISSAVNSPLLYLHFLHSFIISSPNY